MVGVVSLCEGDVHEGPSIWRVCMFIYCTVHTMSIARHISIEYCAQSVFLKASDT